MSFFFNWDFGIAGIFISNILTVKLRSGISSFLNRIAFISRFYVLVIEREDFFFFFLVFFVLEFTHCKFR